MATPSRPPRTFWRAANRRLAASSVAPVASGYERSLCPYLDCFSRLPAAICEEGDL